MVVGILLLLTACTRTTAGQLDSTAASQPATVSVPAPRAPSSSPSPAKSSTAAPGHEATFADPALVRAILSDARRDVVATNSYDYRKLDAFLAAGSSPPAPDRSGPSSAPRSGVISTQAPKVKQIQTAKVDGLGIGSATSTNEATVLVFGQLDVRNNLTKTARLTKFQVVLRLCKVGTRWLIAGLITNGSLRASPNGTPGLGIAKLAAAKGVAALGTYSRKTFSTDYARAVALTTGTLRMEATSVRAATRRALVRGKFDISAAVRASAVASASGRTAVVLVSLVGRKSTSSSPTIQYVKVTVVLRGDSWLLSGVTNA